MIKTRRTSTSLERKFSQDFESTVKIRRKVTKENDFETNVARTRNAGQQIVHHRTKAKWKNSRVTKEYI